ncbi:hypothetical protein G4B88_001193 [Cannabis sativa]|uniref:Cytochrome b561 domain-containing protein n=1 Tax=Cannabis sativa TaxID=3483 RepID=A0A7J6DQ30_CANSA|nr:hypothetical protein G4B88_001193 [Cannabis sativa]
MASGGRSYQLYAGVVTILSHLIAITVTVLVLVWLLKFQGGFAFKSGNTQKIFNLHPFLMVVGLIVIGGEAIMAYKTMPGTRRAHKGVHIILHLLALLAGILGTYAVFKFKDETVLVRFLHLFLPGCRNAGKSKHPTMAHIFRDGDLFAGGMHRRDRAASKIYYLRVRIEPRRTHSKLHRKK